MISHSSRIHNFPHDCNIINSKGYETPRPSLLQSEFQITWHPNMNFRGAANGEGNVLIPHYKPLRNWQTTSYNTPRVWKIHLPPSPSFFPSFLLPPSLSPTYSPTTSLYPPSPPSIPIPPSTSLTL